MSEEDLARKNSKSKPNFPPKTDTDPFELVTELVENFELDNDFDYDNVPFVPKGFTAEEQRHLDSFR